MEVQTFQETTKKELLDQHLLNYLALYEDLVFNQAEIQAALRDGHIALALARRELSRTRNTGTSTISPAQFPKEFEAVLTVQVCYPKDSAVDFLHGLPTLSALLKEPGDSKSRSLGEVNADLEEVPGKSTASRAAAMHKDISNERDRSAGIPLDVERDLQGMRDTLSRIGVAPELQAEIARSVVDDGGDLAIMHGNRLVIDSGDTATGNFEVQARNDVLVVLCLNVAEVVFMIGFVWTMQHMLDFCPTSPTDKRPTASFSMPLLRPARMPWYRSRCNSLAPKSF